MKLFEIIGNGRSGHHAMINWLIKNITGFECGMNYKLNIMENGVYYINEGNLSKNITSSYVTDHINKFKILFISYENAFPSYSFFCENENYVGTGSISGLNINNNYRIIFIRDFFNNLTSRIKSNNDRIVENQQPNFDVSQGFINLWKESAKYILENKCMYLKYEDWLLNKQKRDEFMQKITNHGELCDNKVKGTKSSFNDENYLNRFEVDIIPKEIKELIRKDNELHYLIGALGYEYKKI